MPKIAAIAELRFDGKLKRLFIDGQEFPWYTDGISAERVTGAALGYVTVRIPVERYRETDVTAAPTTDVSVPPPPGRVPAGTLRRADVLGVAARQPGEPLAEDPDAPPAPPFPPVEQGDEGP